MDEYIEREALMADIENSVVFSGRPSRNAELCGAHKIMNRIECAPAADVVPVADMKEFAAEVAYQFGYKGTYNGRLHIMHGGLSTLEWAFEILGWENPHPYPEGECELDGCHEYATCGTPTPNGYKQVCSKHYRYIKACEEAERNARMDGDTDG